MSDIIMKLTSAGQALNAKIQKGNGDLPLEITRIVTGAGTSGDPLNQTVVADERQEFYVMQKIADGAKTQIRCVLTNVGNPSALPPVPPLAVGYPLSQIGFYAMDPDEGEIVYRISQLEHPTWVPALDERPWTYEVKFGNITSNASEVTVHIDPFGLVTLQMLLDEIAGRVPLESGQAQADGVSLIRWAERYLEYVTFPHGQPDHHVDLNIAQPIPASGGASGWLEINIASGYNYGNATGGVTKRIHFSISNGAIISQRAEYTNVSPFTAEHFAIGDMRVAGDLLYVPITHRTSTGNGLHIFVKSFGINGFLPIENMSVRDPYYSPATATPPVPMVRVPRLDLGMANNAYRRKVILLHNYYATALGAQHRGSCVGKFVFQRGDISSSQRLYVVDVATQTAYNQNTYKGKIINDFDYSEPARFGACSYNGKTYLCLVVPYMAQGYSSAYFEGSFESSYEHIYAMKLIEYYDESNATVLNQEIKDSLYYLQNIADPLGDMKLWQFTIPANSTFKFGYNGQGYATVATNFAVPGQSSYHIVYPGNHVNTGQSPSIHTLVPSPTIAITKDWNSVDGHYIEIANTANTGGVQYPVRLMITTIHADIVDLNP